MNDDIIQQMLPLLNSLPTWVQIAVLAVLALLGVHLGRKFKPGRRSTRASSGFRSGDASPVEV